jgi:hypothetical protein
MKTRRSQYLFSMFAVILAFGLFHGCPGPPTPPYGLPTPTLVAAPSGNPVPTNTPAPTPSPTPSSTARSLNILVDDFLPRWGRPGGNKRQHLGLGRRAGDDHYIPREFLGRGLDEPKPPDP